MSIVEGIDGHSRKEAQLEMVQEYMNRTDDDSVSNKNFSSSDKSELSSAQDANDKKILPGDLIGGEIIFNTLGSVSASEEPPEEIDTVAKNNVDADGNGIDDRIQSSSENIHALSPAEQEIIDGPPKEAEGIHAQSPAGQNENSHALTPAEQKIIDELLSTDTDGDGLIDMLDKTGSDSQIKQWYDEEGKELSPENLEKVRAFLSLMAMFKSLDLTQSSGNLSENGNNSIAAMAEAGRAQRATMQTNLSQIINNPPEPTRQSVKEAIEEWKNRTKEVKRSLAMTALGQAKSPDNAALRKILAKNVMTLRSN